MDESTAEVRTILVPTDFSVRSLQVLQCVMKVKRVERVNIVFVIGVILSENTVDLLFFSKKKMVRNLSGKEFREACQVIMNRYGSEINSMRFEIFTGFAQGAFTRFLEGHRIDEMVVPENSLSFNDRFFDPVPFMKRANIPMAVVRWQEQEDHLNLDPISTLFRNWN